MLSDKLMGLIRHVLTFVGGYFVAKGWIDETMLMEIVGAVTTLIGIALSWLDKNKRIG